MAAYLIIGGAGFIGSHLARSLCARGDNVHVVVRETTDRRRLEDVSSNLTFHVADLGTPRTLWPVFAAVRPDVVVHMAAATRPGARGSIFDDASRALTDVSDVLNVLAASEGAVRPPALFLRAGTLAEYGAGPHPFREDQREVPVSPYAAGMIAATHLARVLRGHLSFPVINARLALVYGPGQSDAFLIPQLIDSCLNGNPLHVRYPDERRDLIHIDDVVAAFLKLVEKPPVNHRTINIATGAAPTMREVADLVKEFSGNIAAPITFGSGVGPHGVPYLQGSTELMESLYGWTAKTGIEDGLRDLIRRPVPGSRSLEVVA